MDNDVLLIETWGQPSKVIDIDNIELSESSSEIKKAGLYIEGVFMQANVVNRNNRVYPKDVLKKAVDKYIREQVDTRQALGELNHPARSNVDPSEAAIIIEKLWWDGDNVMGRARIIEGDNGQGDKLAANIRAGWIPGVSSRGLGSVRDSGNGHKIVNEGYRLTVGVDAVWGPSAPDAYVKPFEINESTNSDTNNLNEGMFDFINKLKNLNATL